MARRDHTYGSLGDCTITFDLLAPEGRIPAPTGSMHLNLATVTIYLKQTGTDEFGWVAAAGGGGGGPLPDGDYGDITISGGGTLVTINDGVVTLDKLQDIPSGYVLGRTSPGTGDVELIPISSLGGGGSPAGADREVQWNDGGVFGADAGLTYTTTDPGWFGQALTLRDDTGNTAIMKVVGDSGDGWHIAESFNEAVQIANGLSVGGGSGLWLGRGRGSYAVPEDVVAGDALSLLSFAGYCQSGARNDISAMIGAEVVGVGTYIASNIVFGTKLDGDSFPHYRMRIDSDGGLVLRPSALVDPTGGSMGAGTINAAGLYVNGAPVGGTPAGLDTQVQFNDGGAFGGDAGFTFDKTNKTVDIVSGTVTADSPVLDMTQTWDNAAVAFNAIKLRVGTTTGPDYGFASGSRLLSLGGATVGEVFGIGIYRASGIDYPRAAIYTPQYSVFIIGGSLSFGDDAAPYAMTVSPPHFRLGAAGHLGWTAYANDANGPPDAAFYRIGVGVLGLVNPSDWTAPATFLVYNKGADGTDWERGKLEWASDVFNIGTEKSGAGVARGLALQTDGTNRLTISAAGAIDFATSPTVAGATLLPMLFNQNLAAVGPGFAADTYIAGSFIPIALVKAGTRYRIRLDVVKTAAGVAAPIFTVRAGTAGTTADAVVLTLTQPVAQTAVIDDAVYEIDILFRVVGASAVIHAFVRLVHSLSATGFATTPSRVWQATSGTFDSTTVGKGIGVSANFGASASVTLHRADASLENLT